MPPAAPAFTQACEDRDFTEWHQGCAWCAVWVLWLRAPALAQRVQRARQALGPRLWPGYARQPHVTVAYRGLMAQGAGPAAATFGVAQLRADIARLQQAPAWPR
ncbi:2'-5' RNA ligase family protein, partial [Comamonas aquatica]|nr:2'-5' RNA ligase family protein [Comamonas aquatica]